MRDATGVPSEWLPPIVETGTAIGFLRHDPAEQLGLPVGIPVYHGGGDAASAAIGGGAVTVADAMLTLSTGAQIVLPMDDSAPDLGGRWHTWPAALPSRASGSRSLRIGAMLNAGRALDWIHGLNNRATPIERLLEAAAAVPAGAEGLLFLPYLAGERSPRVDPHARGAFIGLNDTHGPAHLTRAVVDGIALAIADVAETMGHHLAGRRFTIGGGAARSPVVRQAIANALGTPLAYRQDGSDSAAGAAMIAAHVRGWRPLEQAPRSAASVVTPDREAVGVYRERLAIYRDAANATASINHLLAGR